MYVRRAKSWRAGAHARSMRAVSTGSRTLHWLTSEEPGDEDARLVEEVQRNEDDGHIERIGRRRNHRGQDEKDQDGVFAEGAHLRWARHAELGQDEHHNRQLERQSQSKHQCQEEGNDRTALWAPFEEVAHEAREERQGTRCGEEEGI